MTDYEAPIRRLYWLTFFFGIAGFIFCLPWQGIGAAFGFALGAAGSVGNLWLFSWLARAMNPQEQRRKPWKGGLFVARYFVLVASGYVIVKLLSVNALTIVLGLLASTAAAMVILLLELLQSIFRRASSH